jgi:hypothetical protein
MKTVRITNEDRSSKELNPNTSNGQDFMDKKIN